MQIISINNARIPTEKAHGYQIAKMCEEWGAMSISTTLMVPARANPITLDVYEYYGLQRSFTVRFVRCPDMFRIFSRFPRVAFAVQAISFLFGLLREHIPRDAVIITRNPEIAWWYATRRFQVFFDAHNFPETKQRMFVFLLRNVMGIIANSAGTESAFRKAGFTRVVRAPNGVDINMFDSAPKKTRTDLNLPSGHIAMYVGHLYSWKGVDVVVNTARISDDPNLSFVFVGGTDEDVEAYKKKTKGMTNIHFLGHKRKTDIPLYMKSADVLLLPNIPVTKESELYTSPIKLFEYMASGVPIVASDLPSVREMLSDESAILVQPGDPTAILSGIMLSFSERGYKIAMLAFEDVKKYTWEARAKNIIRFMEQKNQRD